MRWRDGWFFLASLQNDEYGHLVFDAPTGQVLNVTYSAGNWVSHLLFRTLELMALVLAILVTPVAQACGTERAQQAAEVESLLAQLRAILFAQELRTILTALRWRYTPPNL